MAAKGNVSAPLLPVTFFGETVLGVDLNAFEVILHDEVDHARHGVRTVGRGRAAADDLDALDQSRRNGIDIDRAASGRAHRTTAVHQHQVTARPQTAQIDKGAAVRARVVRLRAKACSHLRQGIEILLNRSRTGVRHVLLLDSQDRALGDRIATGDARAGHHDFINAGDLLLRRTLRERRRSEADSSHSGNHRGR